MAKRYKTSGRTLGNYRGRTGSLMLVPSRKAEGPRKLFVVAETYGIACGVLAAEFDPDIVSIESEPGVPVDAVPSREVHLDLRLGRFDGTRRFVEIRDAQFLTDDGRRRLQLASETIASWGDSFEFQYRHDAVTSSEASGLQFLLRYKNSKSPTAIERKAAIEVIASRSVGRLSEWLGDFRNHGLAARVLYWCIAQRCLRVLPGERLFPNGRLLQALNDQDTSSRSSTPGSSAAASEQR